ncbi:MAG: hypothetical protein JM58_12175 [Peptococcaceae bacterium BICA1-8]|nr:MAG: hypothetical protein JM58_12175 [Peptococcaceae bacterium BICA1-8]
MKITTRVITRAAILLALAIAVQQMKVQWLTGPAINAILILATGYTGILTGIIIGLFTPVMAFLQGIMPLAIAVPVIMVGNALLCLGFYWARKVNNLVGITVGAIIKFSFLSLAVNYIVQVPPKVAQALSFPQLITALIGGIIAVIILNYLPEND